MPHGRRVAVRTKAHRAAVRSSHLAVHKLNMKPWGFILFVYGEVTEDKVMAFFLNFFGNFKRSAQELKSIRCLAVTAVLIALACILKTLTIQPLPTLKIGFAFVAISAIGMLYGPTVAGLSCVATDVIGYLISNQQQGFSPLFTLVEVTGGVIYGIFLYGMNPIKPDFTSAKTFWTGIRSNVPTVLRIVGAKFTINLVCNVFMNTLFLMIMGYGIVPETFWIKVGERIIKNATMLPIEVFILLLTLFPIKAAYSAVFKNHRQSV